MVFTIHKSKIRTRRRSFDISLVNRTSQLELVSLIDIAQTNPSTTTRSFAGMNNLKRIQIGPPNTSRTPRTFPLFQRLPVELRAAIWGLSILDIPRRLVSVEHNPVTDKIFSSITSPPAIFSVCHESRSQAQIHYRQLRLDSKIVTPIWVDFSHDTIRIDSKFMEDRNLSPEDLTSIQFLELTVSEPGGNIWGPISHILRKLAECENLRHLTIAPPALCHITHQGNHDHASEINHTRPIFFLGLWALFEALLDPKDNNPTFTALSGSAFTQLETVSVVVNRAGGSRALPYRFKTIVKATRSGPGQNL